jgi:ankyrin repeat protein
MLVEDEHVSKAQGQIVKGEYADTTTFRFLPQHYHLLPYYGEVFRYSRKNNYQHPTIKPPLITAVFENNVNIALCLVENGAQPDIVDQEFGLTALSWAIKQGDDQMVKKLVEADADTNAVDFLNQTPLIHAVEGRKNKIVKFLLDEKANINYIDGTGRNALWYAKSLEMVRKSLVVIIFIC